MSYMEDGEIEISQGKQETVVKILVRFAAKHMHVIDTLAPATDPEHLFVIDLSQTRYLDSSGLGFLLRLREQVKGTAKNLVVRGASLEMRTLLESAQFNRLFRIE
ncbi:anti-sigma F factor antagonist, putative [Magnetococcus marinus MC-1]|uniref:Anti-sigma F factor antagonist, putative n=1 Tax=Magnetococcus marinus (strain ATCC BAA-1437 / JCM 17883 / MC-1) TaxID=156889 RepID=A0L671_MAGMM|nr:STAS domain-containing protein [Magnetococcus marinus]ABK43464.1 anti-sigma F factor antagonist, putative [Magnetococcus marinus MC-1]